MATQLDEKVHVEQGSLHQIYTSSRRPTLVRKVDFDAADILRHDNKRPAAKGSEEHQQSTDPHSP